MRKITTLLGLMLLCFISTWAQDYTIQVIPGNGTFYRKGEVNTNNWCERFESNGTPQVVVNTQKTSANPLGERKFNLGDTSGYSFSCGQNISWDLSVEDGYYITGYKIVGQAKGNSCSITPAGGTAVTFTSGGESTVDVSGLWTSSTSYVTKDLTGGDGQIAYTTYEIYVTKKPVKTVEWATENPFTPNDNASAYYVGITTPGTTSNKYTMTAFSFYENSGYGAAARYTAICKSAPSSSTSWKIDESEVLAISNENTTPTAEGYIDYTLSTGVELTGATTYYMVFLTSNTASGGQYTVGAQRVRFKNNSTYAPTVCLGNGTVRSDLIPGFKATLSTDALFTVNYTAKSTVDGSDITSGTFNDVVGTVSAPDIANYQFSNATTTTGDDYDMNSSVTSNLDLIFYYTPLYDVTYNVYMGGTLKGSETVQALHGSAPELPASLQRDFLTYGAFDVAEITSTTTDVNVDATWTGPFEYGSTLATSHWYFLSFRPDASVCYPDYETTGDYNVQAPATRDDSDKFKWAFVGDPINGFTIYNKAAGDGLVLGSATHDPSVDSGNSTKVTMGAPNSQTEEHWFIQTSSHATNGFFIVNSNNQGLNKRSNAYIAYWTSGKDIGSTFVVTDAENFYNQVMSDIKPVYDNAGKPFYTSLASVAPMQALIEQVVNTSFCSQSDYETLLQYVQDAANTGYLYPETGNYRFKNTNRGRNSYIAYGTAIVAWNSENRGNGLVTIDESDIKSDASTVFTLIKTADNNYKISTAGLFVKAPSGNNYPFRLDEESAAITYKFTPLSPGIVAIGPADVTDSEAQRYFHEGDAGTWGNVHCVVQWTASSNASHWSVEEADDITVAMHAADDNKAYATFYAPFDATFTNVTAYTITRGAAIAEGTEAVMTEVTGAVPAGTPVVLVDETGTVAAATANVSYGAAALGVENILSGHYLASKVADGSLVFGQYNSVPGFYRYDDYSTVLGANRAYIAPAQANNVRALVFVSPETGISTTLFNKQNGSTYDLQGRRVQNAQKGIYILNGKKVLVK